MNHIAHITVSAVTSALLSNHLQLSPLNNTICICTCVLFSLLPDIDTPYSYLGRRLKLISIPINRIFGHRTITHSPLLATILLFISPLLYSGVSYGVFCISAYIGVISHIILDFITPKGIPLLYPISKKRYKLM